MAEQSLREFVNTHMLPARVKVTEGIYNPEKTDWEFSNGDVLDLYRIVCPTVELRFVDPATGRRRSITASTCSPCLFRILPYRPDEATERNKSVTVNGVLELIRIWPTVVCVRSVVETENGEPLVRKGDRLRLKRLVQKEDDIFLECSTQHSQLVRLPVTNEQLSCFAIEDGVSYTLAEITEIPGRVERRLRLSDDPINRVHPIRGLPPNGVNVDLFMPPPQRFVEIHPAESPGEQIMAPIDIDITVSDRDDDYCGMSFRWYDLAPFVSANYPKFPMVVSIADWCEEPVSLQAIRASVGDRIVLFRREDVYKFACQVGYDYFAVPLSYDAPCRSQPRTFSSLMEAHAAEVSRLVSLSNAVPDVPGVVGVRKGERLQILNAPNEDFARVRIDDGEVRKLPLRLQGEFQEVADDAPPKEIRLSEIQPSMLPMRIVFYESSPNVPRTKDPIPRRREVILRYIFRDSCVAASKVMETSCSSQIPTRVGISVRYISQYKKNAVLPKQAAMARCPEQLSEVLFRELQSNMTYQNFEGTEENEPPPPLLPRKPTFSSRQTRGPASRSPHSNNKGRLTPKKREPAAPPIPPRKSLPEKPPKRTVRCYFWNSSCHKTVPRLANSSLPHLVSELKTGITPALSKPANSECMVEDEKDYEDIADIAEYNAVFHELFGDKEPPNITVPSDADISAFSWMDMVVFLQLTAMPPQSLRLFARNKISGYDFSRFDNSQLAEYHIDFPIIRHFRNKSSIRGPMAEFL